jgi:hypothetical protein
MDHDHQEHRRIASQSFMQSLAQLEATLIETVPPTAEPAPSVPTPPVAPAHQACSSLESSFEDAVADIEQFIQERQRNRK